MQKASFEGLQQGCRHPDPNFRPFSKSPWLFLTSHLACIRFNCPMMQFWFFFLKWLCRDSVCTCTVIQIKLVVVVSRSRLNLLQNPESWDSNEGNPGSRDSNEGNPRSREGKSRIPKFKWGKSRVPIFKWGKFRIPKNLLGTLLYVLVLNVGTAGGPPLLLAWRHSARRRKSVAWVR